MPDRPILDETAEALASHLWGEFPKSAHNQHNYYAGCAVCQGDVSSITAVLLRAVEGRFRSFAEQYREAGPKQTTLGAQWSATKQAMQWDFVADLIAKGLPAPTGTATEAPDAH